MSQASRIAWCFLLFLGVAPMVQAADAPVPEIPGITAADRFPGACVDCHVKRPDLPRDVRISAHIREWQEKVEPGLLAKLRGIGPWGTALTGRHPPVPAESYKDIPATCIACHAKRETNTVPLDQLLHVLHLTGGKDNHFVTVFGGACTHCHKLDQKAGTWSVPSGPEK